MGAGGSLEHQSIFSQEEQNSTTNQSRYFCHSCFRINRIVRATHVVCPNCESAFVEEIEANNSDRVGLHDARNEFRLLSIDQAIRINSATTMMRLLESHLRVELDNLQAAFNSAQLRSSLEGKKAFSKIMSGKLRHRANLTIDMVCSQPGCPICSEDFCVGNDETQLPCGHLFHKHCVIPWLEMKQNCPVCRQELNDDVPSQEELRTSLCLNELLDKLKEFDVDVSEGGVVSDRVEELPDDDDGSHKTAPERRVVKRDYDDGEQEMRHPSLSDSEDNEDVQDLRREDKETAADQDRGKERDSCQEDFVATAVDKLDSRNESESERKEYTRSMNLAGLLRKKLLTVAQEMKDVDAQRIERNIANPQPSRLAIVSIGNHGLGNARHPLTAVSIRHGPRSEQPQQLLLQNTSSSSPSSSSSSAPSSLSLAASPSPSSHRP
jgi:hypothetical protein